MLEGVYDCFMTCNVFLAGNREVSLELQCFTAELITYIVSKCDAPECIIMETPITDVSNSHLTKQSGTNMSVMVCNCSKAVWKYI